jgi:hypothetical protein
VLGVHTYQYGSIINKDAKGNVANVDVSYGLFFTRSSRTARPFVEQLTRDGKIVRPNLGCRLVTLVEPWVRFLGWPHGVRLQTPPAIAATSLATKVGLQAGDVITAVGSAPARPDTPDPAQETKVDSVGELNDALGLRAADACLWVRFIRPTGRVNFALVPYPGGESRVVYLR